MPIHTVTRKSASAAIARYAAAQVSGAYPLDLFDHTEIVEGAQPEAPDNPAEWFIHVGSFYDRFDVHKLAILASADPLVQAVIKDTSVRKYIDLKGRRAELTQAIALLQSKGFAVSAADILDVKPVAGEVFNG